MKQFTPTFYKLFAVLVGVLVVMVIILNVRVQKIGVTLETISAQLKNGGLAQAVPSTNPVPATPAIPAVPITVASPIPHPATPTTDLKEMKVKLDGRETTWTPTGPKEKPWSKGTIKTADDNTPGTFTTEIVTVIPDPRIGALDYNSNLAQTAPPATPTVTVIRTHVLLTNTGGNPDRNLDATVDIYLTDSKGKPTTKLTAKGVSGKGSEEEKQIDEVTTWSRRIAYGTTYDYTFRVGGHTVTTRH